MFNAQDIAMKAIKNPTTWGVLAVYTVGYLVGDWRGVTRSNKASAILIKAQKNQIALLKDRSASFANRLAVQQLTLNAYDNMTNNIAGGGDPDLAMDALLESFDFINIVRTAYQPN